MPVAFAESKEDVEPNEEEEQPPQDENNLENELIQEEYRVWKKNSPFLYDFVMTYSLDWPSLTVQWLPDKSTTQSTTVHKLILGTQSDGTDQNYLMIADILLPNETIPLDSRKFDDERGEVGGFGGTLAKINIKIKINHDGDVHRARYMPQNPFIVATKSPNPEVLVFDYSKHSSQPTDNICRPQHRCLGHSAGGYGISWNSHVSGHLLSASSDGTICHWDVNDSALDINPLHIYNGHSGKAVEDVDWSKFHGDVFGSVGGDSSLLIWDTRDIKSSATKGIVKSVSSAHGSSDINCISFSPFDEFLLATGGSEDDGGIVKLWDLRNLSHSLHDLEGHKAGVYQLNWSPRDETILASSSEDRRVIVWDTSRIGQEQTPEDAEDGPPELLFVHGGHTSKVFDFSFNSTEDWYLASVAEDNMLQIWKMASTIYEDDDDSEEGSDVDIADEDLEEPDENARKKQKTDN